MIHEFISKLLYFVVVKKQAAYSICPHGLGLMVELILDVGNTSYLKKKNILMVYTMWNHARFLCYKYCPFASIMKVTHKITLLCSLAAPRNDFRISELKNNNNNLHCPHFSAWIFFVIVLQNGQNAILLFNSLARTWLNCHKSHIMSLLFY